MLKLVPLSGNRKTGPIAVTYRTSPNNNYGTCPTSCPLLPILQNEETTAHEIDQDYLSALRQAVPKRGQAWTYSHFPYQQLPITDTGTIINISTDTLAEALTAKAHGYPTVFAAPANWKNAAPKYPMGGPTRFVQCPAVSNDRINCRNCGNGRPLCARPERDYVVVFPGHGSRKKVIGTENPTGGCYGLFGRTRTIWNRTAKQHQDASDPELLLAWTKTLPYGSYLRHHVVGDLGLSK